MHSSSGPPSSSVVQEDASMHLENSALSAASKENSKSSFQTLNRTFAILELFDEERREWSTSQIARSVNLPVPTVHRIAIALACHRYLSQDDASKKFRLGSAALRLGNRARSAGDLAVLCIPILEDLSKDTGETAYLTELNPKRDHSVCLARVEPLQPLRLSIRIGLELPLHAGASQKVMAAFMDPEEQESLMAKSLKKFCRNTITDPGRLRTELQEIRLAGWSGSIEENNLGVWGFSVPVLDESGKPVCAVALAGPVLRLTAEKVPDIVTRVHKAAARLATSIGLQVPALEFESHMAAKMLERLS